MEKDYEKLGVRAELIPILQKLNITTKEALVASKDSKLFNDVCGMRKKLKLNDVKNPTQEEVQGWIAEAGK